MPTRRHEDPEGEEADTDTGRHVERPSPAWWSQRLLSRPPAARPADLERPRREGDEADPMVLLSRLLRCGRLGRGDGGGGP